MLLRCVLVINCEISKVLPALEVANLRFMMCHASAGDDKVSHDHK